MEKKREKPYIARYYNKLYRILTIKNNKNQSFDWFFRFLFDRIKINDYTQNIRIMRERGFL